MVKVSIIPKNLDHVPMLSLGLLYLIGGLTMSVLGFLELRKDPSLNVVILELARSYVLMILLAGCGLLLLTWCCSSLCGGLLSHRGIVIIMLVGKLGCLVIGIWDLAIGECNWMMALSMLLAILGGLWDMRKLKKKWDTKEMTVFKIISFAGGVTLVLLKLCWMLPSGALLLRLGRIIVTSGTALTELAAGVPLFTIGILGICAARFRRSGLTVVFSALPCVLLMMWVMTVSLLFASKTQSVKTTLINSMAQSEEDAHSTNGWSLLQSGFHCCGVNNGNDWVNSGWVHNTTVVPSSCCRLSPNGTRMPCEEKPTAANSFNSTGCLTKAHNLLVSKGWVFGGVTVAAIALVIVTAVTARYFIKTIREPKNSMSPEEPDHTEEAEELSPLHNSDPPPLTGSDLQLDTSS